MADEIRPQFRHGTIRMHGDGPDGYTFPDPTSERFREAAWAARYGGLTQEHRYILAEAASALHHLMTHPVGTEACLKTLRELRRAIRERDDDGG